MKDFYIIFEILGKRVLVLYLEKNGYAPKIVKRPTKRALDLLLGTAKSAGSA